MNEAGIAGSLNYGNNGMPAESSVRVLDLEETEGSIGEFAERVARTAQRIVLRRDGVPLAVIAPVEPGDAETDDEAASRRDEALLHEVSALFADVPLDELEREIAKARAAVRARRHSAASSQ
ncbi:MAG TPA: hypothetical protein VFQ80_10285 [Thermomicrobiales bacterium]|nr:hypothetical protein [Thermomicrobiales bacterium]